MTRNKVLLFPSLFITILGSTLFSFATGLYLLEITGKGSYFAYNIILSVLPSIFLMPILGALLDRFSKKKLILLSDFLNGSLMLIIYLLWERVNGLTLIYIGNFLTQILSLVVFLGFESGKRELFTKEWLTSANAYTSAINSLCRLLGTFGGGVIYAFLDIKYFIFINGVSFLISFIFELFLKFKRDLEKEEQKEKNTFKKALNYIYSNNFLKIIMILGLIFNFLYSLSVIVVFPYLINNQFNLGSSSYGIIQSCGSGGMIIGALLVKRLNVRMRLFNIMGLMFLTSSLIIFSGIPFFINLEQYYITILYSIIFSVLGVVITFFDIPLFTYFQETIPAGIIGKVLGVFISLVKSVAPIGIVISGLLIDSISVKSNLVIGCGLFFLVGILSYFKVAKYNKEKALS